MHSTTQLPGEVWQHITFALIPNHLTIYNLEEYLQACFKELQSFRQTSSLHASLANDASKFIVQKVVAQLGILLGQKLSGEKINPNEGYASPLKLLEDLMKLHRLFKDVNERILLGILPPNLFNELRNFSYPEKNPIVPYIFYLLCSIYPEVKSKINSYHPNPSSTNFFKQSINQSVDNGNLSAIFAMAHEMFIDSTDSEQTRSTIANTFQRHGFKPDLSKYDRVFRACSLNYGMFYLYRSQLLRAINLYVSRLNQHYPLVDVKEKNKIYCRLLDSVLLTCNPLQSVVSVINNSFLIPKDSIGSPEHIALSNFLVNTLGESLLKNKIELLLNNLVFDDAQFRQTFNQLHVSQNRADIMADNFPKEIEKTLDDLIIDQKGENSKQLTASWLNLYRIWSPSQIELFVILWNEYIQSNLPSLKQDKDHFAKILSTIFILLERFFYLRKMSNDNVPISPENFKLITQTFSLDELNLLAPTCFDIRHSFFYSLSNLNNEVLVRIKNYLEQPIKKKNDKFKEIKFLIYYNHLLSDLKNSDIAAISNEKLDILEENVACFTQWDKNLLLAFFSLNKTNAKNNSKLTFRHLGSYLANSLANLILRTKDEYDFLVKILKSKSSSFGIKLIAEFGFKFVDEAFHHQILPQFSLFDYLSFRYDQIEDELKKIVFDSDKNISKIIASYQQSVCHNNASSHQQISPEAQNCIEASNKIEENLSISNNNNANSDTVLYPETCNLFQEIQQSTSTSRKRTFETENDSSSNKEPKFIEDANVKSRKKGKEAVIEPRSTTTGVAGPSTLHGLFHHKPLDHKPNENMHFHFRAKNS